MKTNILSHVSVLALTIALASLASTSAYATIVTIDFSQFPDGTPLSAISPYADVVDLEAQAGVTYSIPDPTQPYGTSAGELWVDGGGTVQGSELWVGGIPGFAIPANATPYRATSKLTITPLQPVTAIAFTTITWPWWVAYSYKGVDQNGEPFTGDGVNMPDVAFRTGPQTTVLDAPAGGYLTQLVLSNWEDSFWLNGLAAPGGFFGVTSLTLRVLQAAGQCPLGQGYWKTQPEAWPLKSLVMGSTRYTQPELLSLMKSRTGGDASLTLARQLICASLNIANGADAPPEVTATMSKAELAFSFYTTKLPFRVKPSSTDGQSMMDLANLLTQFNAGAMTAGCVR